MRKFVGVRMLTEVSTERELRVTGDFFMSEISDGRNMVLKIAVVNKGKSVNKGKLRNSSWNSIYEGYH